MLMPAAVLILVVLGAMAVDRAIVFGAQRDLVATAQAAANDGASAVDIDVLRGDGEVELDPVEIDRAVRASAVQGPPDMTLSWTLDGDQVVVHVEREVDLVFTRGVPGADRTMHLTATARADLRRR
jgi:hypothetical protein